MSYVICKCSLMSCSGNRFATADATSPLSCVMLTIFSNTSMLSWTLFSGIWNRSSVGMPLECRAILNSVLSQQQKFPVYEAVDKINTLDILSDNFAFAFLQTCIWINEHCATVFSP